jgi:N-acetyl-alpha-D-muramate 1-phosphate uridylyltransferase
MSVDRPTRALVLAAGLGQRMRPLTNGVPKPLVRLGGRPLIDHVLDRLAGAGIAEAVVNVHYLPGLIEAHLAGRTAPRITISDEREQLLDTGGAVKKTLHLLGPGGFLVHNSDSVWIEDQGATLTRMIDAWNPDAMDSLLLLAPAASSLGYSGRGDFSIGETGEIRRRRKDETVPYVFAGVSINHPRLFADCPEGAFSINLMWDRAIGAGRLASICLDGTWMHIGTPDALEDAERRLDGLHAA